MMASSNKRSKSLETLKDGCHINTHLLPFKFHFFFSYGGFAAMFPFMPIIAKHLGINATAVGVAYSMVPIFTFMTNPIIGFLVDYFQNIKAFLMALLITSAVAFSSVLTLPPLTSESESATYMRVTHFNDSDILANISIPFETSCLRKVAEKGIECKLRSEKQISVDYSNENSTSNLTNSITIKYIASKLEVDTMVEGKRWITFYTDDISLSEKKMEDELNSGEIYQCAPDVNHCSLNIHSNSVFSSYQFWTFFTLAVVGIVGFMTSGSLSSVASYELLGTRIEDYGRQRLFGTISWGLVCPLSGLLDDLQTEKNFLTNVYIMAAFIFIDIIILCIIQVPKAHISSSMRRDLRKIFTSQEILVFSFGVIFTGILNAIIAVFEFWFLEDMGANRTLLGLSVLMQCLVGEVPFLFFSGWFVDALGPFWSLTCVFCGFSLRLVFYILLKDPWLVLPVDILHGVTFGLFHGAMTTFAKVKAPKGMEATLLGFFGGLYEGLGYGLGSFIGGIGMDKLGAKKTFLCASIFSLGCFFSFSVASCVFKRVPKVKKPQLSPAKMKDFPV